MRSFLLLPAFALTLLAGCDKVVDPAKPASTAEDSTRKDLLSTEIPEPRAATPIILPDSLLDTTRLHLANAKLLRVDSGIDYATLTIQTPHPGIGIALLMRSHEEWLPTGGCRADTTAVIDKAIGGGGDSIHLEPRYPTMCWDGVKIVSQKILVVGFADPTKAYAQVATTLKVAVPWSSLDSFVDFLDRDGDTLSAPHR